VIVVDSSVWIDYFTLRSSPEVEVLDRLIGSEPIGVGDLILLEVLQGFRSESDALRVERSMRALTVFPMLDADRAVTASLRYRELRRAGVTVRSSIDVAIASFCISEGHRLLTSDKDFDAFAERLGLLRA
jgi:predicted nucleic acid-binding protein